MGPEKRACDHRPDTPRAVGQSEAIPVGGVTSPLHKRRFRLLNEVSGGWPAHLLLHPGRGCPIQVFFKGWCEVLEQPDHAFLLTEPLPDDNLIQDTLSTG